MNASNNIHHRILSLSKPIKQEYPYKEDLVKAIKKSDEIKLSGYGAAKAFFACYY